MKSRLFVGFKIPRKIIEIITMVRSTLNNNQKFYNAYFKKYKNIWHHGDYAMNTNVDGFIIYGRSDATLNAAGIRIGTAELYRIVENIDGNIRLVDSDE